MINSYGAYWGCIGHVCLNGLRVVSITKSPKERGCIRPTAEIEKRLLCHVSRIIDIPPQPRQIRIPITDPVMRPAPCCCAKRNNKFIRGRRIINGKLHSQIMRSSPCVVFIHERNSDLGICRSSGICEPQITFCSNGYDNYDLHFIE